jgi:hypothetical protein
MCEEECWSFFGTWNFSPMLMAVTAYITREIYTCLLRWLAMKLRKCNSISFIWPGYLTLTSHDHKNRLTSVVNLRILWQKLDIINSVAEGSLSYCQENNRTSDSPILDNINRSLLLYISSGSTFLHWYSGKLSFFMFIQLSSHYCNHGLEIISRVQFRTGCKY